MIESFEREVYLTGGLALAQVMELHGYPTEWELPISKFPPSILCSQEFRSDFIRNFTMLFVTNNFVTTSIHDKLFITTFSQKEFFVTTSIHDIIH